MYKSKARRPVADPRTPLPGGTTLPPGQSHSVNIQRVIVQGSDNVNDIQVIFEDSFNSEHLEKIFIRSTSQEDLSGLLKQLIAAIATNSKELRSMYEDLTNGDWTTFELFTGRNCIIETEFNERFVNIKSIRSANDRDNGGSFFQPTEANPESSPSDSGGQHRVFIPVPERAANFF